MAGIAVTGELELDILRHLEHPNVVRVLGHGHWPDPERGYLYLVMEYVVWVYVVMGAASSVDVYT
ncbi:hypothetical protein KYC5002_15830 [Archangium violaceum]|uniref:hypothetical protein n=1 Tax=Archangium violaceum TaxID=83451 RepID=UPI002B281221|nr:hypothetical protein KYC5002_15830 [Archangium gephyra]